MIRSLLLFCTLCISLTVTAQPKWGGKPKGPSITGKITGKLIDEADRKGVSYATVVLMDASGQKQIDGTISDEDGKFKLTNVAPGVYTLQFSFIGYETKSVPGVKLTPGKPDFNMNEVLLSSGVLLDEVVVTEEASIVENKVDKIVYNAEKDVNTAGGDASDVLRKVPLLTVDLEGNISLRGSANIRILINGKPSGMFANNVADALKSIPAEQIKSVEVITTPSAKYDGEGSAGIVNIITKKKNIQGFTGSVSGSIGTRQNNGVLSLNAGKGRLGVNFSGSTWYSWPRDGTSYFLREATEGGMTSVLEQKGLTESRRVGFNGSLGVFYDFNAYNSFSSNIRLNGFGFDTDGGVDVTFVDPVRSINQIYNRNQIGNSLNSGYDWTNDFRRTFKKPEQELTLAVQVSGNIQNRETDVFQLGNDPLLTIDELTQNDGNNLELTFQADYVHPFSKKVKLEIGAKSVLRDIDSDYSVDVTGFGLDPTRTDVFRYDQDVYAGYTSFTFKFDDKHSMIAGVRYENTSIAGEFDTENAPFSNSYENWLPSIIVSKKLKKFQTIKASYSRRIQRPSLFYINPYLNDNDRLNVTFGNPELNPEVVDQFEVSYNTFIKGTVVNAAIYYKHTSDVITQVLEDVANGVSLNTYKNVGEDNSIGINLFSSARIKKFWQIRGNLNVFTYNIEGTVDGESLSNDGILFGGFIGNTFTVAKGLRAEFSWFGRSARRTIQGRVPSFDMFSFGVKKEIWKKRGTIGITIIEPFRPNKSFNTRLEGDDFLQRSEFTIPFQSFGINFSYRFGKLDFKEKKRNSRIKNDDVKGSGDGQGGRNF